MRNGYGVIGVGPHTIETAHRVAWRLFCGPIPDGLWVLHRCDVRLCANPSHLYLGTVKENARDLWMRGRPIARIRESITPEVEARRVASLPRGAAHHRSAAKITEDIARQIYTASGSQRSIAALYGICQQMVSRIKRGRDWRHIHA